MTEPPAYAHTLPERPSSDWEPLERHLQEVAQGNGLFPGAAGFAAAFGASDLARLAGLWHDLGKYAPAFQQYLHDSADGRPVARGSVDHATAGALHAITRDKQLGLLLAFVIAGHHAGLADLGQRSANNEHESSLLARIFRAEQTGSVSRSAIDAAPAHITSQPFPPPPALLTKPVDDAPLRVSLFIRMLFSCLIDADRLATEAFANPQQGGSRPREHASIVELRRTLDKHLEDFAGSHAAELSPVNAIRARLLGMCRRKAELPPGLFSLTAPTGSGKTLSSMAFALRHAERHGMRRVIYALPFTSVTEQNARVFREAFAPLGERVVLEHHSAYRPSEEISDQPKEVWRRLAAENWDAPVIVTTNVQLLESLFSENPSRCRKLHRIAGSVIVLDEAQALR